MARKKESGRLRPAAGEYSRTAETRRCPHPPSGGKPWKTPPCDEPKTDFPQLWSTCGAGRKALQNGLVDRCGQVEKSSLRGRADAAMLAHPERQSKERAAGWSGKS